MKYLRCGGVIIGWTGDSSQSTTVQNDNPPVIFDDTLPCTGRAWLVESTDLVVIRFFGINASE